MKEYDVSIWIDGNVKVKGNLLKFISQYDLGTCSFWVRKHPQRDCIYDEGTACIALHKDSKDVIDRQTAKYKSLSYPAHNGLAETNVILRKHSDLACQKLCEMWASEICFHSFRDQLSFNYACYACRFKYGVLSHESDMTHDNDSPFFMWFRKHNQSRCHDTCFSAAMSSSDVTVAICNFNTSQLTNDCIMSIC